MKLTLQQVDAGERIDANKTVSRSCSITLLQQEEFATEYLLAIGACFFQPAVAWLYLTEDREEHA